MANAVREQLSQTFKWVEHERVLRLSELDGRWGRCLQLFHTFLLRNTPGSSETFPSTSLQYLVPSSKSNPLMGTLEAILEQVLTNAEN
jgi:hypothetical protein